MTHSITLLHGVGTREDLPLPFALVVTGAAVVLIITFVGVLRLWRSPRWERSQGLPLPRLTRVVDHPAVLWAGRGLAMAVAAVGQIALWFGTDQVRNPFPGLLFVWVWVGLVPCSLLLGAVWRRLSPIRVLLAWRGALGAEGPLPRWGVWPGVLGLLGFGFLELVQPDRTHLDVLRVWFVAWLVWVVVPTLVWGSRWIASADPFEVYATAVSRISPWQRIDGVIHLVNPLRQLSSVSVPRGTWAVGGVLIGITAFDSLGTSSAWVQAAQNSTLPRALWGTVGLLVLVALALGLYALGASRLAAASRDSVPSVVPGPVSGPPVSGPPVPGSPVPDPHVSGRTVMDEGLLNRLGVSLVPIAVGYTIAHYATYLVLEGQRVAVNLSDPLSRGQDWFGTATLGVDARIFEHPSLMAWNQVLGIVVGHVVAVLVAHDLAIRWLPPRRQVSGQIPLLAVMVVFTCGGLLLLFQA